MTPTPAAAPPPRRPAPARAGTRRPGRTPAPAQWRPSGTTTGGTLVATGARPLVHAPRTAAGAPTTAPRGRFSSTPARMRIAATIGMLASALAAFVGLGTGLAQSQALADAAGDTAQQVRALEVRNALVAADATATNAFLVGGREPVAQRARYDEAMASATGGLVTVAGADADDAERLATVGTAVATYNGLIEQARANNRQGFPVGAAYLETASQELRASALPGLDRVVSANHARVSDAFGVAGRAPLATIVLALALAALLAVQVWLANRTHRRLNAGLVGATVALVASGLLLSGSLTSGADTANAVERGEYTRTVAVARAYSLANDAKAMESFTLIKRGSGQAYEESYAAAVEQAQGLLDYSGVDPAVVAAFEDWTATHADIRDLDDGGDWDGAVELATSDDPDAPNARFDAFAQTAQAAVAADGQQADEALDRAARGSTRLAWVALVGGLAAAVCVAVGFSARLREYR